MKPGRERTYWDGKTVGRCHMMAMVHAGYYPPPFLQPSHPLSLQTSAGLRRSIVGFRSIASGGQEKGCPGCHHKEGQ